MKKKMKRLYYRKGLDVVDKLEREIIAIVDAPEVVLSETEKAGEALVKFYEALGWNSETDTVDPCKVRTTKSVYDRLSDVMYEKCSDNLAVGMAMVNRGPGVDDDVPFGKVYLLKGWTFPFNPQEGDTTDVA